MRIDVNNLAKPLTAVDRRTGIASNRSPSVGQFWAALELLEFQPYSLRRPEPTVVAPSAAALPHHARNRTARRRVQLLFHASRKVCITAGLDGELHSLGHADRILRGGDGCIHEDAIV